MGRRGFLGWLAACAAACGLVAAKPIARRRLHLCGFDGAPYPDRGNLHYLYGDPLDEWTLNSVDGVGGYRLVRKLVRMTDDAAWYRDVSGAYAWTHARRSAATEGGRA